MNEVAKLAKVSPATVSRVLSKRPYISADTANRVMAAVEELNYHRNMAFAALPWLGSTTSIRRARNGLKN